MGDRRDQGGRAAGRRLARHGLERAQPARTRRRGDPRPRRATPSSELGFVRNDSARQLRAGPQPHHRRSSCSTWRNPFFTDVARGVEDVVERPRTRRHGVQLAASDASGSAATCECSAEQRVRGVLITPADGRAAPAWRSCATAASRSSWSTAARAGDDRCSVAVDDVARRRARRQPPARARAPPARVRQRAARDPRRCTDRRTGALRALARAGLPRRPSCADVDRRRR